jgi:hypothetical protein
VAQINQPKAVGHSFSIVEMKKRDSRTTTGGNAFDTTTVEAKMAIPSLLTWIEEEDNGSRDVGSTDARSVPLKRLQ